MSTSLDYVQFVTEQCSSFGLVSYKKMFGEYTVYINGRPLFLVCDNIVFLRKHECLETIMKNVECGYPYQGAKESYIVDVEDKELLESIIELVEPYLTVPKKRKKVELE